MRYGAYKVYFVSEKNESMPLTPKLYATMDENNGTV